MVTKFTNSAGEPITFGQATFAFACQILAGAAVLFCLYWATVFAFCL